LISKKERSLSLKRKEVRKSLTINGLQKSKGGSPIRQSGITRLTPEGRASFGEGERKKDREKIRPFARGSRGKGNWFANTKKKRQATKEMHGSFCLAS